MTEDVELSSPSISSITAPSAKDGESARLFAGVLVDELSSSAAEDDRAGAFVETPNG